MSSILIVEDHLTQQYVFKELCQRFGFESRIVSTGEEALGALAVVRYAAVILDMNLPGITGVDTVRALRLSEVGTTQRTPVIAITANAGPLYKEACLAAGMDDYLSKPFSIDAFRKTLLRWTYDESRPNLRLINCLGDREEFFG